MPIYVAIENAIEFKEIVVWRKCGLKKMHLCDGTFFCEFDVSTYPCFWIVC